MRFVVLAKQPLPGGVKTRLSPPEGPLAPQSAASIAAAMLRCTLARLAARGDGEVILAAAPDGRGRAILDALELEPTDFTTLDQGPGDLGVRLLRIWHGLGAGPTAFLGADTPDIPDAHLDAIAAAVATSDAAIGPTDDGGYWTLAASKPRPALLHRIDWGSRFVYDQTSQRAAETGFALATIPTWQDVDRIDDVLALQRRLEAGEGSTEFGRLKAVLAAVLPPTPARSPAAESAARPPATPATPNNAPEDRPATDRSSR